MRQCLPNSIALVVGDSNPITRLPSNVLKVCRVCESSRQLLFNCIVQVDTKQTYFQHDDCSIAMIRREHTDMTNHPCPRAWRSAQKDLQARLLCRHHLGTRASALTSNGSTATSITESVLQKTRRKKLLTVFRKWHLPQGNFGPHFLHRWARLYIFPMGGHSLQCQLLKVFVGGGEGVKIFKRQIVWCKISPDKLHE